MMSVYFGDHLDWDLINPGTSVKLLFYHINPLIMKHNPILYAFYFYIHYV